LAENEKYISH